MMKNDKSEIDNLMNFEKQFWASADALRNNMDAAE